MSDEVGDRAGLLGQDAFFSLELDNWLDLVFRTQEGLGLDSNAIL